MMRSIRGRLLVSLGLIIAATLACGSVATYWIVERELDRELDRVLFRDLGNAAPQIFVHAWLRRDISSAAPRLGAAFSDPGLLRGVWLQAWDAQGNTLYRSAHLGPESLPRLATGLAPMAPARLDVDGVAFHDLILPNGAAARAVAARIEVPAPLGLHWSPTTTGDAVLEIELAHTRESVELPLAALRTLMLVVGIGVVGLALGTTVIVVRAGLRPLDELREQIDALGGDRLDHRFHMSAAPRELVPIRDRLDEMLNRMAAAFRREQEFAANAAHELGTPLSGLRTTLEVALQRRRPADEYRASLGECLAICLQMQATVEGLLGLFRSESAASNRGDDRVELGALVEECWRGVAGDPPRLVVLGSEPVTALADRDLLRQLLVNLLDNAIEHGAPATPVEAILENTTLGTRPGRRAVITVRNAVCEAPPPDLAMRAFDAFWRGDRARGHGRHVGLGLSLCRSIAQRLEGDLSILRDGETHVRVRLELPAAP